MARAPAPPGALAAVQTLNFPRSVPELNLEETGHPERLPASEEREKHTDILCPTQVTETVTAKSEQAPV